MSTIYQYNTLSEMKTNKVDQLDLLTGIRGLAALAVFFLHYKFSDDVWTNLTLNGGIGVTVFFCLSGFLMVHTSIQSGYDFNNIIECKNFWLKRAIRIYPMYLVSLFISFYDITCFFNLNCIDKLDYLSIILHLFGIDSWLPIGVKYWNVPSWSVSTELFFYFIFPFLFLQLQKMYKKDIENNTNKNLIIFGAIALLLELIPIIVLTILSVESSWRIKILPYIRISEFMIGMLTSFMWHHSYFNNLENYISQKIQTIIFYTIILFIIFTSLINDELYFLWFHQFFSIIPCCFILLYLVRPFHKNGTLISSFLGSKHMVLFGHISYSFYLLHLCIFDLLLYFGYIFPKLACVKLLIVLALSYIAHFLIENPCLKLYKRIKIKEKEIINI